MKMGIAIIFRNGRMLGNEQQRRYTFMEKKIVAGIIGLEFGRAHLEGALAYGAEIGLICDCDEKSLKFAADKYNIPEEKCTLDYHDIINNPEINAVSIGIPDQLHKQVALEMLEAGKHVLCEKPLALTKEDITEMVRAAR
ncbi:MAG: Gfo/Idh/MocA family oxidoreductase, partial [Ruminococcaceae bacterium]|nr:Gfo/Idh/MocA family oxidoreductase [Oscillospiraceae bacterium]